MKKCVLSVLTVVFATCCMAAGLTACIERPDEEPSFTFDLNEDNLSYSVSVDKAIKQVTIPSEHEGLPVTRISDKAFSNCKNIETVYIPDTIVSIGQDAFVNCTALTDIAIPQGITSIDVGMFENCSSLTNVSLPDSITEICERAFYNCKTLSEIVIPSSVTAIGSSAFGGCTALTEIEIPDSVTDLGTGAFGDCAVLGKVAAGSGLTAISDNAFLNCAKLKEINIPENVTYIGSGAFNNCTALTEITLPDGVKSLGANAFRSCTELSLVNLGEGLRTVGTYAFEKCGKLTEITLPESVVQIGLGAFYDCVKLSDITIYDELIDIEQHAFENTAYYENEANWTDGALYLSNHLVQTKTTVSGNFKIKDGTVDVAKYAFSFCNNLTGIYIPDSLQYVHAYAFYRCDGLETINVGANNERYRSEGNCLIEKDHDVLILGCNTSVIPEGVTGIGNYAFNWCGKLTEIILPESVTLVGNLAFYGCSALKSLTVNGNPTFLSNVFTNCNGVEAASVTSDVLANIPRNKLKKLTLTGGDKIYTRAMYGASDLESVTIPDTVTSIGAEAFYNCGKLTDIYFKGSTALWNSIKKEAAWDGGTGNYTVHCSDGEIPKNKI